MTYNILNYAADDKLGSKTMDGTMYRPWWSWIHADFTVSDGVDDYGTANTIASSRKIMLKTFLQILPQQ